MKCNHCKRVKAAFVVKTAVNKKLAKLYLCGKCLEKKGAQLGLDRGEIFRYAQMIPPESFKKEILPKSVKGIRCKNCGYYYENFRAAGKLSCPQCYQYFGKELTAVFTRLYGAAPAKTGYCAAADREFFNYLIKGIAEIEKDIKKSVSKENFEAAQKLKNILSKMRGYEN